MPKYRSRQSIRYHFIRSLIFFALGGRRCRKCGAEHSKRKPMHLDVLQPAGEPDGHHSKMSSSSRAAFYWRQFLAGNLQPLCEVCSSEKRWEPPTKPLDYSI